MTGKNLLKRKIIDKLLVEPSPCLSTRMVLHYLETCRETGSPIDPAWLQGRNQVAADVVLQGSVKRKDVEGPSDTP